MASIKVRLIAAMLLMAVIMPCSSIIAAEERSVAPASDGASATKVVDTTTGAAASTKSVTTGGTTTKATTDKDTQPPENVTNTPATVGTANSASSPQTGATSTSPPQSPAAEAAAQPAPLKTRYRPGDELTISTKAEELQPTDDVQLARQQVAAYPDNAEASFILAVALTRTSKVEDALQEVRRAKKLAQAKGGNYFEYFDKMIASYEEMLKSHQSDNRIRYQLAWAYYMKAYLVANYSQKVAAWKAAHPEFGQPEAKPSPAPTDTTKPTATALPATGTEKNAAAGASTTPGTGAEKTAASTAASPNAVAATTAAKTLPALIPGVNTGGKSADLTKLISQVSSGNTAAIKIPSILDKTQPADVPQIKRYYELALKKLDDLIARKPDDVWALVYRAHLKAEYTGNLEDAMKTWANCKDQYPNNPASYFFLGEGYLKQGNLKESINNVSRAVALRAMGF